MLTTDQINELHRLYWNELWPIRKTLATYRRRGLSWAPTARPPVCNSGNLFCTALAARLAYPAEGPATAGTG
jgi:hypothetical protein